MGYCILGGRYIYVCAGSDWKQLVSDVISSLSGQAQFTQVVLHSPNAHQGLITLQ